MRVTKLRKVTAVEALTIDIGRVNKRLSDLAKKGIDCDIDLVSDDESDADLIDLISVKKRIWEPELLED